jgi:D-2-hydroxyacid dehydrogenase (NADP+)
MSKKLLLVNLHSSIREFCLQERHKPLIKEIFKDKDIYFSVSKDDFQRMLPQASIALVWVFQKEWYALAPVLETVLTPAAGKEWVQDDPTGKVPARYGHFHGNIIAETVLGMMLHFNRQSLFPLKNQAERRWERNYPVSPVLLRGQTVLIIGYGAIGRHIAELLAPFKCRVIGVKRKTMATDGFVERVITINEIRASLPLADHVVITLPGGGETDGLITKDLLLLMKRTTYLYNVGRGNCLGENDLVEILKEQKIAGVYLDVFDPEPLPASSELWGLENVVITPHSSAFVDKYLDSWLEELGK